MSGLSKAIKVSVSLALVLIFCFAANDFCYGSSEQFADSTEVAPVVKSKTIGEILESRDSNHREWQILKEVEVVDPITGEKTAEEQTSTIIEVGGGICYQDDFGDWQLTDASWRKTDKGFIMDTAGYELEIGNTVGEWLRYRVDGDDVYLCPSALRASDGTKTVDIATLNTESVGQIDSDNPDKLLFADAYGKGIDLELQVLPSGYHQNVIFHTAPSIPADMDLAKTQIEVHTALQLDNLKRDSGIGIKVGKEKGKIALNTEFETEESINSIDFVKEDISKDGSTQDAIRFSFGKSRVLDNGTENAKNKTVASKKIKQESDGACYLIETLPHEYFEKSAYPVTWDYVTVSSSIQADEEWYADNTYYVSAAITINSGVTLRIEPGTIIKFADNGGELDVGSGILIASGKPYEYIIFTSENDDVVGDEISTSSGTPSAGDWNLTLSHSAVLDFCKIAYTGYNFEIEEGEVSLTNSIITMSRGIEICGVQSQQTIKIFNNLITDISGYGINACASGDFTDSTYDILNNTFNDCDEYGIYFSILSDSDPTINVINNLFANCDYGAVYGDGDEGERVVSHNGFYASTPKVDGEWSSTSDVDLTVSPFNSSMTMLGTCFLNDEEDGGADLINAGYGNVEDYYDDPNQWAVHHIEDDSANGDERHYFDETITLTSDEVVWSPNLELCDESGSSVDIGYHHPRVDYLLKNNVTVDYGCTLVVEPGTVVAMGDGSTAYAGTLRVYGEIHSDGDADIEYGDIVYTYMSLASSSLEWFEYKIYNNPYHVIMPQASYNSSITSSVFLNLRATLVYTYLTTPLDNNTFKHQSMGLLTSGTGCNNTISNSVFVGNTYGIYTLTSENAVCNIVNSVFYGNFMGGYLFSSCEIQNCTFDDNFYGVVYAVGGSHDIQNCIFSNSYYGITNNGATLTESYNAFYNNNNHFSGGTVSSTDLAGEPTVASTTTIYSSDFYNDWTDFDERFRLPNDSQLVDAGSSDSEEMYEYTTRIDSRPDLGKVDLGYHYPITDKPDLPYISSFENANGFELDESWFYIGNPELFPLPSDDIDEDGLEGWQVSDGDAVDLKLAVYCGEPVESEEEDDLAPEEVEDPCNFAYHYLEIADNSTLNRNFFSYGEDCDVVRISCIPEPNSCINILNGSDVVASIEFDVASSMIEVLNYGQYQNTGHRYRSDVAKCLAYLANVERPYPEDPNYTYENTWVDIKFVFDWSGGTYDVFWSYEGATTTIKSDAYFDDNYLMLDGVEFVTRGAANSIFALNRVCISDETTVGGQIGMWLNSTELDYYDAYITNPIPVIDEPFKGRVELYGSVWYENLGYYVISACEVSMNPNLDRNWTEVCKGANIVRGDFLGYWDTAKFFNGDHYLKIEVYDDLGRLYEYTGQDVYDRIMKGTVYYNGTDHLIDQTYPVEGRLKAETLHYEEKPDIAVKWPGEFPFEFKRIYNNYMRRNPYPLFFGWTHNHNIKITENCQSAWNITTSGPDYDPNYIGIGRIWLTEGASNRMFICEDVIEGSTNKIVFIPEDSQGDYIVRNIKNVDLNALTFDVDYIYYGRDARVMEFSASDITIGYNPNYTPSAVGWNAVAAIDKQYDRYGNFLEYEWEYDPNTNIPMYITQISNSCTPAKIQFTTGLDFFGDNNDNMYSKAELNIGSVAEPNIPFSVEYSVDWTSYDEDVSTFDYVATRIGYGVNCNECYGTGDATDIDYDCINNHVVLSDYYEQEYGRHYGYAYYKDNCAFNIINIRRPRTHWTCDDLGTPSRAFCFDEDGALRLEYISSGSVSEGYGISIIEYLNDYNRNDELETEKRYYERILSDGSGMDGSSGAMALLGPTDILDSSDAPPSSKYGVETLVSPNRKNILTRKNNDGAIVEQITEVIDNDDTWPLGYYYYYCYSEVLDKVLDMTSNAPLKGVVYEYNDLLYPLKPTAVYECFEGECPWIGSYTCSVPTSNLKLFSQPGYSFDWSRKTNMEYDEFGNLTEKRVYVNDTQYVGTQWEYHPLYSFVTKETTWQDYCEDDPNGDLSCDGPRVEKIFVYGNANDSPEDPNFEGVYLLAEKVLHDDSTTPEKWVEVVYDQYDAYSGNPWNAKGLVKSITNPVGTFDDSNVSVTCMDYDPNGFIAKIWQDATLDQQNNPVGDPHKRFYNNSRGLVELEADVQGKVAYHAYDDLGREYATVATCDLTAISLSDSSFTPNAYIQWGNPEDANYAPWESMYCYGYDGRDNRTFEMVKAINASSKTVDDKYVGMGQTTKYMIDNGLPEYVCHGTSHKYYVYVGGGFETYTHDAACRSKISICDAFHNNIFNFWRSWTGSAFNLDRWESSEYLTIGTLKSKSIGHIDSDGVTLVPEIREEYEYDILNRMTKQIVDPIVDANYPEDYLTITTEFGYDAAGNRTYVIDPNGNVLFTDYDNKNRKIATYFPIPEPNVVLTSGDLDVDATRTASNMKLKTAIEYYNNDKVYHVTSYDYDGLTVLKDVYFEYDGRGRITQVDQWIDGSNYATTTYAYSDTGFGPDDEYNVEITDAEGQLTYIAFDAWGRRTKTLQASGDYDEVKYNGDGTLAARAVWDDDADPNDPPDWVTYGYDNYGHLTGIWYPGNTDPCDPDVEIEYDSMATARIASITDNRIAADNIGGSGEITFEYDALDRIVSYTDHDDYTVSYDYRGDGQKLGIEIEDDSSTVIYDAAFDYDNAGRLTYVYDPTLDSDISNLGYTVNGSRAFLRHYVYGDSGDIDEALVEYEYNSDNRLIEYWTTYDMGSTFEPFFEFNATNAGDIDGLGRLVESTETLDNWDPNTQALVNLTREITNEYDGLGQLTEANITDVQLEYTDYWHCEFDYKDDGNISGREIDSLPPDSYSYNGDVMTYGPSGSLTWDLNGQLIATPTKDYYWTEDYWLRNVSFVDNDDNDVSVSYRYTPQFGNMVYREKTVNEAVVERKKIISDITGKYPLVLMEIEMDEYLEPVSYQSYYYANNQILAQLQRDTVNSDWYYYLCDRLGSVRTLIDCNSDTVNSYTYDPFGNQLESETHETVDNPYQFAGYRWDEDAEMFYCNARWYNPEIYRFTGRDPVRGKFNRPMSLHAYLYCYNNPINRADPTGLQSEWRRNPDREINQHYTTEETLQIIAEATEMVGNLPTGPFNAFGYPAFRVGVYDYKGTGNTFQLGKASMRDTEFGNYLAGYASYYNYKSVGDIAVRGYGHLYSLGEYGGLDGPDSIYYISAGIVKAQADLGGPKGGIETITFMKAKLDMNGYGLDMLSQTDLNSNEFDRLLNNHTTFWNAGVY